MQYFKHYLVGKLLISIVKVKIVNTDGLNLSHQRHLPLEAGLYQAVTSNTKRVSYTLLDDSHLNIVFGDLSNPLL